LSDAGSADEIAVKTHPGENVETLADFARKNVVRHGQSNDIRPSPLARENVETSKRRNVVRPRHGSGSLFAFPPI